MDRLLSPTGSTPNLLNAAATSSYMPHHWSSTNLPGGYEGQYNVPEGRYNVSEGRFNTIAGHGHWHHAQRHHPHAASHYSPSAHGHFAYPPSGGHTQLPHHAHTLPHPHTSSMSVLPTSGGSLGYSPGTGVYATAQPKNPPLGYIVAYTPEQIADLMTDQLGGVPQVTPAGHPTISPSQSPKHRPLSVHTSTLSKVINLLIILSDTIKLFALV